MNSEMIVIVSAAPNNERLAGLHIEQNCLRSPVCLHPSEQISPPAAVFHQNLEKSRARSLATTDGDVNKCITILKLPFFATTFQTKSPPSMRDQVHTPIAIISDTRTAIHPDVFGISRSPHYLPHRRSAPIGRHRWHRYRSRRPPPLPHRFFLRGYRS
jgi:hypothetical protein